MLNNYITVCSPVFPTKCLNNRTYSSSPNIWLHPSTSLGHCEAMVYHMIHKCCPDFVRNVSMWLASSYPVLSSSSTDPHPSSTRLTFHVLQFCRFSMHLMPILSVGLHYIYTCRVGDTVTRFTCDWVEEAFHWLQVRVTHTNFH